MSNRCGIKGKKRSESGWGGGEQASFESNFAFDREILVSDVAYRKGRRGLVVPGKGR